MPDGKLEDYRLSDPSDADYVAVGDEEQRPSDVFRKLNQSLAASALPPAGITAHLDRDALNRVMRASIHDYERKLHSLESMEYIPPVLHSENGSKPHNNWLDTFVEIVYVAAMIQVGRFLEEALDGVSEAHIWLRAGVAFYTVFATYTQFVFYQAHFVTAGCLGKLVVFMHCLSMAFMGGYADFGYATTHHIEGGHEGQHKILTEEGGDGSDVPPAEQKSDQEVAENAYNIFVLGLMLSRITLCLLYFLLAYHSVGARDVRRICHTGGVVALVSVLVLGILFATQVTVSVAVITIFVVVTWEFVLFGIVWGKPTWIGAPTQSLIFDKVLANMDALHHFAHEIAQFMFIVLVSDRYATCLLRPLLTIADLLLSVPNRSTRTYL